MQWTLAYSLFIMNSNIVFFIFLLNIEFITPQSLCKLPIRDLARCHLLSSLKISRDRLKPIKLISDSPLPSPIVFIYNHNETIPSSKLNKNKSVPNEDAIYWKHSKLIKSNSSNSQLNENQNDSKLSYPLSHFVTIDNENNYDNSKIKSKQSRIDTKYADIDYLISSLTTLSPIKDSIPDPLLAYSSNHKGHVYKPSYQHYENRDPSISIDLFAPSTINVPITSSRQSRLVKNNLIRSTYTTLHPNLNRNNNFRNSPTSYFQSYPRIGLNLNSFTTSQASNLRQKPRSDPKNPTVLIPNRDIRQQLPPYDYYTTFKTSTIKTTLSPLSFTNKKNTTHSTRNFNSLKLQPRRPAMFHRSLADHLIDDEHITSTPKPILAVTKFYDFYSNYRKSSTQPSQNDYSHFSITSKLSQEYPFNQYQTTPSYTHSGPLIEYTTSLPIVTTTESIKPTLDYRSKPGRFVVTRRLTSQNNGLSQFNPSREINGFKVNSLDNFNHYIRPPSTTFTTESPRNFNIAPPTSLPQYKDNSREYKISSDFNEKHPIINHENTKYYVDSPNENPQHYDNEKLIESKPINFTYNSRRYDSSRPENPSGIENTRFIEINTVAEVGINTRPRIRNNGARRRARKRFRTTTTTTTTTLPPNYYDDYEDDYYYYDYQTTTTTTTQRPRNRRINRGRRRSTPSTTTVSTTTTSTTTTTLSPNYKHRKDNRIIDYMADPNFPHELKGADLTEYPFYISLPDNINFDCSGRHDGYYASIEHYCQVYHQCAIGHRYDFLCPNYTLFDQTTFTCRFVNTVDCPNSERHFNRNDDLYVETTELTVSEKTNDAEDITKKKREKREKIDNKKHIFYSTSKKK